jgi:signal transduction histidine kinase
MGHTYWLPRYIYLLMVIICVLLIGRASYQHITKPAPEMRWNYLNGTVYSVDPHSPLAEHLQPGMRILRFDDLSVRVARHLRGHDIGEEIRITYMDAAGRIHIVDYILPAPDLLHILDRLISVITATGFLLAGSAVIFFSRRDQQTPAHLIFFIFSIVYTLVLVLGGISSTTSIPEVNIFHIATWWAGALIVYLHLYFPIPCKTVFLRRMLIGSLGAVALAGSIITLTVGRVPTSPYFGTFAQIRYSWLLVCFLLAAGLLVHNYMHTDNPHARQKIRIVTLCGVMAVVSFVSFFALPTILTGFELLPIGVILLTLLLIPAGYAYGIFGNNLLELDETIHHSIALITKAVIISSLCTTLYIAVTDMFDPFSELTGVIMAPVCGLLAIALYGRISQRVDTFFYGSWHDSQQVLQHIQHPPESYNPDDRILHFLERLQTAIRFDQTALLTLQKDGVRGVLIRGGAGNQTGQRVQWDRESYLWHYLRSLDTSLPHRDVRDALKHHMPASDDKSLHHLLNTGFRLWIPLLRQGKPVGALIVGHKSGFDDLTPRDRDLLHTLADYTAMFIYNTLLMQEVRQRMVDNIRIHQQNLSVREDERKRIARDLHDDIIQKLVSLNYTLAYRDWHDNAHQAIDNLRGMVKEDIRDIIKELRTVCSDLRPPTLDELGLIAALRSRVRAAEAESSFTVDTEFSGQDNHVPESVAISTVRLLQEALHNIRRHAEASHVKIKMTIHEQHLMLYITDDGCGFDVPETVNQFIHDDHFGIVGMKERVEAFDGTLTIHSARHEGTQLVIYLPFMPQKATQI